VNPGGLDPDKLGTLRMLASSTTGYTVTVMMEHGFKLEMLTEVVSNGLARATRGTLPGGRRSIKVTWLTITADGRKALAGTSRRVPWPSVTPSCRTISRSRSWRDTPPGRRSTGGSTPASTAPA
jgi:hypothetical protein